MLPRWQHEEHRRSRGRHEGHHDRPRRRQDARPADGHDRDDRPELAPAVQRHGSVHRPEVVARGDRSRDDGEERLLADTRQGRRHRARSSRRPTAPASRWSSPATTTTGAPSRSSTGSSAASSRTPSSALLAFEAGEVDYTYITADEVERARQHPEEHRPARPVGRRPRHRAQPAQEQGLRRQARPPGVPVRDRPQVDPAERLSHPGSGPAQLPVPRSDPQPAGRPHL